MTDETGRHPPEWPNERQSREKPLRPNSRAVVTPQAIKNPEVASGLVDTVIRACEVGADPKETLQQLREQVASATGGAVAAGDESADAFVLSACVEALKRRPSYELWRFVTSLGHHSSSLDYGLYQAAIRLAKADADFRSHLREIAHEAIERFNRDPAGTLPKYELTRIMPLREQWMRRPNLTDLWLGLNRHGSFVWRGHMNVVAVIAELDVETFVALLGKFSDAYSVAAALEWQAGVSARFARWQIFLSLAPPAFEVDGTWNGSPIVPLLLSLGLDNLSEVRRWLKPDASEANLARAVDDARRIVGAMVETLSPRMDGWAIARRWATWLMRRETAALAEANPSYPANIQSPGFIEAMLIDELIKRFGSHDWPPLPSTDADPWEWWNYRCVLVNVAFARETQMPELDGFLSCWKLTHEDWYLERGNELRNRASVFGYSANRADSYAARLLSLPMAESANPVAVWVSLWEWTLTLREILEFGEVNADQNLASQGSLEAGRLMRILFSLGLMMLDHMIIVSRELKYDRLDALRRLLPALLDAVREMKAIDRFNSQYWDDAFRHLALRRMLYLSVGMSSRDGLPKIILESSARPTVVDFIRQLDGNVEGLLAFIDVSVRNAVDPAMLRSAMAEAGVDLETVIGAADHLVRVDPRRAGVDAGQLATARSLLG